MNIIKNIVLLLLMLTLIVSLHELGHLLAAKLFGVYVKEYAIGMGPKLFSKKGKETVYSIRAIPLGGFVALAGEDSNEEEFTEDNEKIPHERTLKGIARWKQIIVMLAGIFMNFVLAIVIYSMIILNNGSYVVSSKPVIDAVNENSPAMKAGLQAGDLVTSIGFSDMSISPNDYVEVVTFTSAYDGNGPWSITVGRDGQKYDYEVMPEYKEADGRYYIGISFGNAAYDVVKVNIFNCWYYGVKQVFFVVKLTIASLISVFRSANMSAVSGPIGIYSTVSEVSELGWVYYAQLIAIVSISVGIMNALPLPIFDGGRVLIVLIEAIIHRDLDEKTQGVIMTASMVLLLMLMVLVTYNDILKLAGGK
jgi:regulator of sigma E protease